jgi:hypothetical protein
MTQDKCFCTEFLDTEVSYFFHGLPESMTETCQTREIQGKTEELSHGGLNRESRTINVMRVNIYPGVILFVLLFAAVFKP